MKTTIDIADTLLMEAKKVPAREGTTVKALVDPRLRRVVAERRRAGRFRLRNASFKGQGLQQGVQGFAWDRIRNLSYEGRGA